MESSRKKVYQECKVLKNENPSENINGFTIYFGVVNDERKKVHFIYSWVFKLLKKKKRKDLPKKKKKFWKM